jgi:hypothetical protein
LFSFGYSRVSGRYNPKENDTVKLYVLYTFVPNAVEHAQDGIPEGHEVVAVLNKKPSSRTYTQDGMAVAVAGSEVTLLMGIPEPEAKPETSEAKTPKAKTPDPDPAKLYLRDLESVRWGLNAYAGNGETFKYLWDRLVAKKLLSNDDYSIPEFSACVDVVDRVRPVFEAAMRDEDYVPEGYVKETTDSDPEVGRRYREFMEYVADNKVSRAKALKLWHLATGDTKQRPNI